MCREKAVTPVGDKSARNGSRAHFSFELITGDNFFYKMALREPTTHNSQSKSFEARSEDAQEFTPSHWSLNLSHLLESVFAETCFPGLRWDRSFGSSIGNGSGCTQNGNFGSEWGKDS